MPHKTNTLSSEFSRVQQVRVPVTSDADILLARQHARELASEADFTAVEATFIATAISELGRNILQHAGGGEVSMKINQQEGGVVLIMVARDNAIWTGLCKMAFPPQVGWDWGCPASGG
jgi:serine/threonine-protein kinase RsbT